MVIFIVAVIILVLILALAYLAYYFIFRTPSDFEKRKTRDTYLHSPQSKQYAKQIKQCFADMDELEPKRVYLKSRDGLRLAARFYEFYPGKPVCILMHGYKGEAVGAFCAVVPICKSMGCNVLLPDQRASGVSEGKCQTFGIKERFDILDWVKFVRKRCGENTPVLLIGKSMGAASVLMASPDVQDNVKGIVSDCSYTSVYEEVLALGTQRKLPVKILYPIVKLGAKLFGDFDIEEESPEKAVSKSKVPVCFIHGYLDDIVPYTMCGKLYDACSTEKSMYTFDRAGHACSVYENPQKYENALKGFASKVLG